ncbi:MAG TPA: hypothetical protein VJS30_05540, partial [Paraburkholderia sp.]|nr:hypothetical protein [Paraburkholderia sp.]
ISHGCSYHGVSLNVSMDLSPFLAINPCGYAGLETVDMATLGVQASWRDVAATLAARLDANLAAQWDSTLAATLSVAEAAASDPLAEAAGGEPATSAAASGQPHQPQAGVTPAA